MNGSNGKDEKNNALTFQFYDICYIRRPIPQLEQNPTRAPAAELGIKQKQPFQGDYQERLHVRDG